MSKGGQLAVAVAFFVSLAHAIGTCPVTLVSGTGDVDGISITFRNAGKLPIRRLEFNCTLVRAQAHKSQSIPCREENALFFPGTEYTVKYPYREGTPRPILVSLKSATSADGYVWKPSKRLPCRSLKIHPRKTK
ncbi:MAG TPA: hypothetical protein VK699_17975 [Terriglobales bacterium]|jgi:hypothetical protein|nr:hypothetical protein [Terriglobales bacterium]